MLPVTQELLEDRLHPTISIVAWAQREIAESLLWALANVKRPASMTNPSPFADYKPRLFLPRKKH